MERPSIVGPILRSQLGSLAFWGVLDQLGQTGGSNDEDDDLVALTSILRSVHS